MEREQFTFYRSFAKAVQRIRKKADRTDAYDAIVNYALDGIEPDIDKLPDMAAAVFLLCKPNLDAARRKAEGGKRGSPAKDIEKITERYEEDTANKKEKKKENKIKKEEENECSSPPCGGPPSPPPEPAAPAPVRRTHGANGRVKLSEEEYNALLADLGQAELDRCVAYVDEFAAMTGNKQKWKDWNLVLRKCHREQWGMTQQEKRANTAKPKGKPSSMQIEAMKRMMEGNA